MNYTFIKKITQVLTFGAILVVASLGAVPATAAPSVTVNPTSAADSSTTPLYGINLTSCLEVFNWQQYMLDLASGITNSNPYDKFDCVREESLVVNGTRTVSTNASGEVTSVDYNITTPTVGKTQYRDFTVGQTSTRNAFGDLPVLGIFPNSGQPAQSLNTYDVNGTLQQSEPVADRSVQSGLDSIFDTQKQDLIFTTGGSRDGMPRIPYTGQETFIGDIWQGGTCTVENGRIVTRSKATNPIVRNGRNFGVEDFGFNPDDPITTCAWPDEPQHITNDVYDPEGVVKDRLLEVYQFVYKVPYPADFTECNSIFPGAFNDYNSCISWFRERFSVPFTGQATGDALYQTLTYYGAWNDVYERWVGWENPDVGKARETFVTNASLAELRNYYNDPEAELRQVYGDTVQPYNFTYTELLNRIDTATPALQNQYKQLLADRYSSFVRGADGYSSYAI
jgi:hypothetical protein